MTVVWYLAYEAVVKRSVLFSKILSMLTDKTFRILSIDGGGIKGLYAAKVLEKLEEYFQGKQITDHFDLICGTSTGGLIALALALKYRTSDISKFYIENASSIFPKKSRLTKKYGQIFKNLYKSQDLKNKLTQFFGENRTLGECHSLVCIPSFNISRGQPIVFKQKCDLNGYVRDQELNIIDVALATASAPTYFRNHYIDHPNLVNTY